jgi:hypothetical protein
MGSMVSPTIVASDNAVSLRFAVPAVVLVDVGSVLLFSVTSPGRATVEGPHSVVVLDVVLPSHGLFVFGGFDTYPTCASRAGPIRT